MKSGQTLGIVRNRYKLLSDNKQKLQRKKNRFKIIDREDSFSQSTPRISENLLTSASSTNNSIESLQMTSPSCRDFYDQAREKLTKVQQLQKKMSSLTKARLSSFKQKQNDRYDQQISKLASQATNVKHFHKISVSASHKNCQIVQAQYRQIASMNKKVLISIKKVLKNMQLSLAQQIRQSSRNLRQQQREYYDTIRQYESSSNNKAIQLTEEQKKMFQVDEQMLLVDDSQINKQDSKITELVQSINKLSGIYKQLNNLVIEQGSLIDRIDVNIQETYEHTVKAVKHLQAAEQHASSAFADKVIKVLVILIITMALVLGVKYMG